jgi:hypothetical protein
MLEARPLRLRWRGRHPKPVHSCPVNNTASSVYHDSLSRFQLDMCFTSLIYPEKQTILKETVTLFVQTTSQYMDLIGRRSALILSGYLFSSCTTISIRIGINILVGCVHANANSDICL